MAVFRVERNTGYSFGYVAGWSSGRELSELKSSLETIRSAAAEIINSIDENLAELQKAQDKEQTAGQEQPTREEKAAPKEQPQPEAPAKADKLLPLSSACERV